MKHSLGDGAAWLFLFLFLGGVAGKAETPPAKKPVPLKSEEKRQGGDVSKAYKLGPFTEVRIDGAPALLSGLMVGMRAYVDPDSFEAGFARSIDAHIVTSEKAAQCWIIAKVDASSIVITYRAKAK